MLFSLVTGGKGSSHKSRYVFEFDDKEDVDSLIVSSNWLILIVVLETKPQPIIFQFPSFEPTVYLTSTTILHKPVIV